MSENDLIDRLNEIREEIRKYGFDLIPINISIAQMEALNPDLEYRGERQQREAPAVANPGGRNIPYMSSDPLSGDGSKPQTRVEETIEITQDLTNVTIMAQTKKAILAVKAGYQKWIPLSCIDLMQREVGFDLGSQYDIILDEKKEWILKKPWDIFKPQKGGK